MNYSGGAVLLRPKPPGGSPDGPLVRRTIPAGVALEHPTDLRRNIAEAVRLLSMP
jgi:hypothetical protein